MELTYVIRQNDTISRWNLTPMGQEAFSSPKQTFDAPVNMEESYVQVVYPVREAFWKEKRIEKAVRYDGEYQNLYFPFENNRVDLSTFIHTPHYIYVNAKAGLRVPRAGLYPFMLYTCGGVKVWVNGVEQALFAPYTRNIAGSSLITLKLEEGYNEIKVYADELAERDVFFYFELRYQGDIPLEGVVDVLEDPEQIRKAEKFLTSCYFEKDMYLEGQVKLCYDPAFLESDETLYITRKTYGTGKGLGDVEYVERTVKKNENHLILADTDDSSIQISRVSVCMQVGRYLIPRNLFVGIIPREMISLKAAPSIRERKRQALAFVLENGELGCQSVIASLELLHSWNQKALAGFDAICKRIEAHEDCADFSIVPLSLVKIRYGNFLSEAQEERIRQMVLRFRYWIDEPGDDVMWYFSENHAFLFHCAQYLWGYLYPEETFEASQKTGLEQYRLGKERVKAWFDTFFACGFAEWNSATYIPIDLIGFFTLYMGAPDPEIRALAKKALDQTMKIIVWNSFEGIMNSTYGRTYEENIKTRIQTEPNFINWISFGEGYVTYYGSATGLYAISDYEPEDYQSQCLLKKGEGSSLEYLQGMNNVSINVYRTREYLTAGVRQFKPFRHGHQQHLMNVVFGKENPAIFYVNHPGERMFSGENRPSYWAGNGTIPWMERYGNLTAMIFDTDPNELVHYIHAYTPLYEYDEYRCSGNWFFARSGDGYLGCWFSNGYTVTTSGANCNKELISQGLKHGLVVKCGSQEEFGSFQNFQKALEASEIHWDGHRSLSLTDCQYGTIRVENAERFLVNGQEKAPQVAKDLTLATAPLSLVK